MSSVISQLQNQIMVQIKEERLFRESLWKSGLDLLQEKIYREIHYRNLPSEHPFIRVSIKWIPGFQHFLSSCGFGNVVQPTKDFRSSSPITIIEIVTNEELQKIFPNRLRRKWTSGWSILEAPFYFEYSKNTQIFAARFRYLAYTEAGILFLF